MLNDNRARQNGKVASCPPAIPSQGTEAAAPPSRLSGNGAVAIMPRFRSLGLRESRALTLPGRAGFAAFPMPATLPQPPPMALPASLLSGRAVATFKSTTGRSPDSTSTNHARSRLESVRNREVLPAPVGPRSKTEAPRFSRDRSAARVAGDDRTARAAAPDAARRRGLEPRAVTPPTPGADRLGRPPAP